MEEDVDVIDVPNLMLYDDTASGEDGPDAVERFDDQLGGEEEQDTTVEQLKQGRDIQGIPWERLEQTRDRYRATRISQYRNYTNVVEPLGDELKEHLEKAKKVATDGCFYNFVRNSRSVQSNIVHFQLRNLVWATSRHDVYVVNDNCVNHWNPVTRTSRQVLNLAVNNPRGPRIPNVGRVQVSTICVSEGLVAAGGFNGEMVCKKIDSPPDKLAFSGHVTHSENGITNAIEIFDSVHLGRCVMTSNNDSMVRIFQVEGFKSIYQKQFPWAVNFATMRPGGNVVAVVGDDCATHLTDVSSGVTVAQLKGHLDYSFAAAWHPDTYLLATGNQDTTTLVWDIRFTNTPLCMLAGRMGAIRSTRFSRDGQFLAMSEPLDFVHIYDVKNNFRQCQVVDIFGEIAGISFSPDSELFFTGIADPNYSSLLEYDRYHDQRLKELMP